MKQNSQLNQMKPEFNSPEHYQQWLNEVKEYGANKYPGLMGGFTPDPADWIDYYNDNYTPAEAVEEDIENWL